MVIVIEEPFVTHWNEKEWVSFFKLWKTFHQARRPTGLKSLEHNQFCYMDIIFCYIKAKIKGEFYQYVCNEMIVYRSLACKDDHFNCKVCL